MRPFVSMAVLTMLSLPVGAAEYDAGFRLGIGAGSANTDFDRGFAAGDTALSAYAAYDFNRHFGMEVGFVDAGAPEENGVAVEASYASVVGIASWPFWQRWSIFARGGLAVGAWQSAGLEREDTTFVIGAGTAVDFNRFQLRLIGDVATIDDARIVHVSLQGAWKF